MLMRKLEHHWLDDHWLDDTCCPLFVNVFICFHLTQSVPGSLMSHNNKTFH